MTVRCEAYGTTLDRVLESGTEAFAVATHYREYDKLYAFADDVLDWTRSVFVDDLLWDATYKVMVAVLDKSVNVCAPSASEWTVFSYAIRMLSDRYESKPIEERETQPESCAIMCAALVVAMRNGMIHDLKDLR